MASTVRNPSAQLLEEFHKVFRSGRNLGTYARTSDWSHLQAAFPCFDCHEKNKICTIITMDKQCTSCKKHPCRHHVICSQCGHHTTCTHAKLVRYLYFSRFAGLDLAHARLFFRKHCDDEQEKSYGISQAHWAKLHTSLSSSTPDQHQALRLRISRPRPEKRMLSPSDVPPTQSKKTKLSVPETLVEDPQPARPVPTTRRSKFKPSIPRSFNPPPPISTPQSQSSSEHSTTLDPQSLPQLETNGSTSSSDSIQRKPNGSPEPSSSERELAKLTSLLKDTAALLAICTEEVQRLQHEVKVQALGNTLSQEYVTLQNLLPGPPSIVSLPSFNRY